MSVNGLDKITGRILAEANAEAEDILSRAREECAQISADYADPVGIAALRARQLKHDLHDRRMADCKSADTDKGDCV